MIYGNAIDGQLAFANEKMVVSADSRQRAEHIFIV
jgi:hypothetical protein